MAIVERISTAKVVVLSPPAVEPGLPPISISKSVITSLPGLKAERSTVLKPAVLGATLRKAAFMILSPIEKSLSTPSYSNKKNKMAGTVRRIAVVDKTIF